MYNNSEGLEHNICDLLCMGKVPIIGFQLHVCVCMNNHSHIGEVLDKSYFCMEGNYEHCVRVISTPPGLSQLHLFICFYNGSINIS